MTRDELVAFMAGMDHGMRTVSSGGVSFVLVAQVGGEPPVIAANAGACRWLTPRTATSAAQEATRCARALQPPTVPLMAVWKILLAAVRSEDVA